MTLVHGTDSTTLAHADDDATDADLAAVCTIADLPIERGVAALVDEQQVALFRLADGTIHALDHHDPATGANVLARGLLGTTTIDGVDVWYVASPLRKHRYRLDDGTGLDDPSRSVRVHDVVVADDTVHVRRCG